MKEGSSITVRVKYTKDRKGEHRFALIASNGKTLAVSSEGYKRKADAVVALELILGSDDDKGRTANDTGHAHQDAAEGAAVV